MKARMYSGDARLLRGEPVFYVERAPPPSLPVSPPEELADVAQKNAAVMAARAAQRTADREFRDELAWSLSQMSISRED